MKISSTIVPPQIKKFAVKILGKATRKYFIRSGEKALVDIPWSEYDREYWQVFKLAGSPQKLSAETIGHTIVNSGWGESAIRPVIGEGFAPRGHVVVKVGVFPPRVEIYTSPGDEPLKIN